MDQGLLGRVRKLLAKSEAEGCTPEEAQALTAKAAELMAKYGIDRALLGSVKPETDKPADRTITFPNPWARVQSHLWCALGSVLRCQSVLLPSPNGSAKVHTFGYESDLERLDVLYTSILLQMTTGLRRALVPSWSRSPRAWRRSWMLGFSSAVVARVREAEIKATAGAKDQRAESGKSTAVVLADRSTVIGVNIKQAYPITRSTRTTYSGSGYSDGHTKGQQADLGGGRVGGRRQSAIGARS